jgi:predicted phage terminase large subunit-like protein
MILPSPDQIKLELARRDLIEYAKLQWPGYRANQHHYAIANVLERVAAGEIKRLMIFAPPRHGKSVLTSENFPPWFLGNNPDKYIIHATYAQELAEDFGRKIRNQMQDSLFKSIFTSCNLSADSASQKRLTTTSGGAYFALGVGGAATGRGAHIFLIDDPIKGREEAESEAYRRKLKDWYKAVAYTRLMPGGAVVIMLTRWHHDDLAGWLLREHASENFHILSLPAIAEDHDPLGRKVGEPLWPSDYPLSTLQKIKEQLGSRDWSALYQQQPTPEEGSIFKIEWFSRYHKLPPHPKLLVHSWDTGIKDEEINDPTSCTMWHAHDIKIYLADRFNRRLQFPDLRRAVQSLAERDNPNHILIEDKGSGQQLLQVLQRETRLPVIGVMPKGGKYAESKIARAQGVSGLIESGRVCLPESAPWLVDYESEIAAFPNAPHDDDVDSTTQALKFISERLHKRVSGESAANNRRLAAM